MKRVIIAAAAAALLALAVPASPVGAQATTDVYAIHGLNLAGQSEPGGTVVTVCAGDTEIDPSFEFGDVIGPLPLPSGVEVSLQVYVGADQDCVEPAEAPLIDQTVTPTGAAVALVATAFGSPLVPELLPFPIDLSCVDPGNGGAVAAHAANAPMVDVVNTTLDLTFGPISYGEQIPGQLPAGDYDIEVFVVDDPTEPITSFTIPVTEGNTTIGYAVGNQPGDGPGTPIVLIAQVIPVSTCEAPPTPTPAPTAPPAATPATAQPAFTG